MLVMFPLNNENGQILRTKRWLYEALGDLMAEKPFADITVGQLCKRADVSRAVFYNHYANKEDLLHEVFKRIVSVYWKKVQLASDSSGHIKTRAAYTILCKELWRSRLFLYQIYKNNYGHLLVDYLIESCEQFYLVVLHVTPPALPEFMNYFIPYHATAMAEVLFQWICQKNPISCEQMADMLLRLLGSANVDSFLNPPINLVTVKATS